MEVVVVKSPNVDSGGDNASGLVSRPQVAKLRNLFSDWDAEIKRSKVEEKEDEDKDRKYVLLKMMTIVVIVGVVIGLMGAGLAAIEDYGETKFYSRERLAFSGLILLMSFTMTRAFCAALSTCTYLTTKRKRAPMILAAMSNGNEDISIYKTMTVDEVVEFAQRAHELETSKWVDDVHPGQVKVLEKKDRYFKVSASYQPKEKSEEPETCPFEIPPIQEIESPPEPAQEIVLEPEEVKEVKEVKVVVQKPKVSFSRCLGNAVCMHVKSIVRFVLFNLGTCALLLLLCFLCNVLEEVDDEE